MGKNDYSSIAEQVVDKAKKMGVDSAETYISNSKELSIEVNNQQVETLKMSEEIGIGLRVFQGGRMGLAYSTDFSKESLETLLKEAVANGEKTSPDEFNSLPEVVGAYKELELEDKAIFDTPVEDKIEFAKQMEQSARAYDNRVKNTRTSSYQDAHYHIVLANSNGTLAQYKGSYCGGYAYLVAEENGDNQTGFGVQYSLKYGDLDPKKIGEEAAQKAVQMLGSKTIETQKAALVLDPYIATNFLGVIAPALTAEAAQKGKSLFAKKVGQKVGSDLVNIVDDGAMVGGIMSGPFDGEGVPTSRTTLISGGTLEGFLHNTYTAKKDGVESTGNGIRNGFKGSPEVGTTNFFIEKGNVSKDKLIGDVDKGLYVTEVMGMHTANPISGDFSLGAAGIWIENGKLTKPVRGIAIAGNVLELLKSIDCVADDLTFYVGKGAPTIRIPEMTISG